MICRRPLPHDTVAESALLGSLLLGADLAEVPIVAHDFSLESNGLIYEAIRCVAASGIPADGVTVAARLERQGKLQGVGGRVRLLDCVDACPLALRAPHYARIVGELAARRRLIRVANELASWAHDAEDVGYLIADVRTTLATELERVQLLHARRRR